VYEAMSSHFAFHDLFELLPKGRHSELYDCPFTCRAAFHALSGLAQQYVHGGRGRGLPQRLGILA